MLIITQQYDSAGGKRENLCFSLKIAYVVTQQFLFFSLDLQKGAI